MGDRYMGIIMFQLTIGEFDNLKSQIATSTLKNIMSICKRKNQIKTAGDWDEIKFKIFNNVISSK